MLYYHIIFVFNNEIYAYLSQKTNQEFAKNTIEKSENGYGGTHVNI